MNFNGQISEDKKATLSRLPAKLEIRKKHRQQVHAVYNVSVQSPKQSDMKDVVETSRELEDLYRTAFKRYKLPAFTKRLRNLTLPATPTYEVNSKIEESELKPGKVSVVNASLFTPSAPTVIVKKPIPIRKKSSTNLFWEGVWGDHLTYRTEYDQLHVSTEENSDIIPKFMKLNGRANNRTAFVPTSEMYSSIDKRVTPVTPGNLPFPHVNYFPSRIRRVRNKDKPMSTGPTPDRIRRFELPWRFSSETNGVFKMNFSMD